MALLGPLLEFSSTSVPSSCLEFNKNDVLFFYLALQGRDEKWNEFYNKCQHLLNLKSQKTVSTFLKFGESNIDFSDTYFSKKKYDDYLKQSTEKDQIVDIISNFWLVRSKENDSPYQTYKSIIKEASHYPQSFYINLLHVIIFQKTLNIGAAKKHFYEASRFIPIQLSFQHRSCALKKTEQEGFEKSVTRLFRLLPIKEVDEISVRILREKMQIFSQLAGKSLFSFPVEERFTVSELRKMASSAFDKKRHSNFIAEQMADRLTGNEINDYIRSLLDTIIFSRLDDLDMKSFYYHFPTNHQNADLLVRKVEKMLRDKNLFSNYQGIILLENKSLKNKIAQRNKKFARPLFQIKRDFFHDLYREKKAVPLAIYHLLELGEFDFNFLWWLACE